MSAKRDYSWVCPAGSAILPTGALPDRRQARRRIGHRLYLGLMVEVGLRSRPRPLAQSRMSYRRTHTLHVASNADSSSIWGRSRPMTSDAFIGRQLMLSPALSKMAMPDGLHV
jgi:hypothetical protein